MAAAVYLTVNIVQGIAISGGWTTILIVALVWSVIITVVKPILQFFAFSITLMTLGIFYFVINAFLFWAMQLIVPGFYVNGFIPALLGSIVLSVISWLLLKLVP